jgi:hypothetical protein
MSDNTAEAREQCHAIFNNMAFADVVVAADRLMTESADGTVTTRKVASVLGVSDSIVRPVLVRLVVAQLLDELPKVGAANGPRLFHRRNEDRWAAICALIATIGPQAPAPTRRRSARRP